jgi:hypothetical protein
MNVRLNDRPMIALKHHKRQPAAREVLLIDKILISSDHNVEAGFLGGRNQLPILKGIPTHLKGGSNIMC